MLVSVTVLTLTLPLSPAWTWLVTELLTSPQQLCCAVYSVSATVSVMYPHDHHGHT